jgi:hypothetical protein
MTLQTEVQQLTCIAVLLNHQEVRKPRSKKIDYYPLLQYLTSVTSWSFMAHLGPYGVI